MLLANTLPLVEKEDIIVVKNSKAVAKLIRYTEPDFFVVHEEAKGYRATRKISYEEYMELVNSSDQRYELIDGEVYLLASPVSSTSLSSMKSPGISITSSAGKPASR